MSLNQSRADKSEAQLKKPGRSGSSSQQRSFAGGRGKGGSGTAPPPSSSSSSSVSSSSANRSFKKINNGQGAESRVGLKTANSESSAAVTASHAVQNDAHVQSQLHDAPVSGIPKPSDSSISRSPRGLPRAPSSQSAAGATDSTVPTTPSKGDVSRPFPLQFGSISPGFMDGMQIPARTSSAPPNLDEQKRDQALHDSLRAMPNSPIPSAPKQQQRHQLRKDIVSLNQSNTVESHPPAMANSDVHVQSTTAPAATTQKSSILPVAGTSMPMPFRPPQVPVQFGGHRPQIQTQGITPSSLQMSMQLPVGNATQVQQQLFVPGLQSHPLRPQGIMHQGQSLGFAPQIGHQLVPQLGNLGIGMPPQFSQPGKFGAPRKTVKITHPETHEELKLEKRRESYMDVGSSGPRSHPSVPAQSQPITSFPVNYYSPMQPNSYNPSSIFFPTSTSLPLTSTQLTPGSSVPGYNYPVGRSGKNVSFMNTPALNPLAFNKSGHPMHGKSEPWNLEQVYDGHAVSVSAPPTTALVQVTLKPAAGSLVEKAHTSSILVTSPVSKAESRKLLKQPAEASITHHKRDSEIGLEYCVQQPKSIPESSDSIPLPATVKHSTPSVAVSTQGVPPSTSSVLVMTSERSASVVTTAESRRRESVRRSDSLKDQQKKPSVEDLHHFQQHQPDATDSTGSLKLSLLKISTDSCSSELHDGQICTNLDENVHAPSEAAVTPTTTTASTFSSSSIEYNCCSLVGVSESEESKGIPSKSEEASGVILERATEISQDISSRCNASKTTTDGGQVEEGGPREPRDPSGLESDETTFGNLDACAKQDDSTPLEVRLKQETSVTTEHRKTEMPDYSPQDSYNLKVQSTVSESSVDEMSQIGTATNNMQETDVDDSSCTETEHIDMNVEAVGCNLEVEKIEGNIVWSTTTPSGSINAETFPSVHFPSTDSYNGKTSPAETCKITSGKINDSQEEVALTDSGISSQETAPTSPSISSEATREPEGRVTESSSGNPVFTSSLGSKDKISVEQNQAKGTPAKKKKRKEFLKKADAAGRTSDLYMAYKGPEETQDISITSEIKDSSPANVKQASADDAEKDVVATENDGQSKGEVDDWEDAAEISTPKLKASENKEQVCGAQKQNDGYGSGITGKKKYSRDFLLTLSEQFTDLPASFEIRSDLEDALMSAKVAISHRVDRESYPNSGRIIDRQIGGSRVDRRGIGIVDDKWSKVPAPFASGRDPRLDVGFGGVGVNFRPGQGGNHGVLRNPRGQSSAQYVDGILAGPMQSLTSPGGMPRNSPDTDRWQRATGKGLIPPPQTPLQAMHRAEKKYEIGKVSDEEEAKQRQLKAILNKLTPQNFDKLFEQVKAVNIDNATTLTNVISQIFDKALTEPTFCEMYANFCFHLATALPNFSEDNEKITFKRLLLNKCQEEFERGEREQAEANRDDEEDEIKWSQEEKEQKKVQARRRMLGNIRLIGELYKKKMLTERIMHECIKKLLGQYQNPDEEDVEALCKLMSTIGEMIDHPKAKEHMDAYFDVMLKLSTNQKLSSRVRFMLKDAIDLRKNRWQQRRKVEGPKKIEEVHRDAAQERQEQATRLSRGSAVGSSRRGQHLDYVARGSTTLSSLSSQQMGAVRGLSPQSRGYGIQDARMENRHPFEKRTLSIPSPQRPIDDDSITLGPQGGLARGMSIRGQPLMSNAPLADVSSSHGNSRRMVSGPNGYSSVSDWSSYNNSPEELMPRYVPDRLIATPHEKPNSQDQNAYFGNRDLRNADRPLDRSILTTPATGSVQGPSTRVQSAPSEPKVPAERLRDMSIAAIREFYSARNEEEVRLCIKELNSPSFFPDMVMLWVNDSFDRKNDIDRDLLAKLLVNLCMSQDSLLNRVQLSKGFESVLSSIEDAVTDSPKAAEYLGRILGTVILEKALSLREIGILIHEGGEEPGSLLQSGLASDVLVSILEIIRREKGESFLDEIRTSSNLRLEDFRPPGSIKQGN